MTNRRSFIAGILALGAAPAIVRADSLMRIVPRDVGVIRLENVQDAIEWMRAVRLDPNFRLFMGGYGVYDGVRFVHTPL